MDRPASAMLPLFLRLRLSGRLNDHLFVGRDIGIYGMIVKKRFALRKSRRVFRDVVCAARILIALTGTPELHRSSAQLRVTRHMLAAPYPPYLLNQRASVAVGFFFWRDHNCCGYAVAWLHLQQAHALCVAAGFADGL